MIIKKCPFCGNENFNKEFAGHPRFYELLAELAILHHRKNSQYTTANDPLGNFRRCGALASKILRPANKPLAIALAYMSKQVDGVFEIVGEDKKDTVEELKDKLRDIAVYSIICEILSEDSAL